MSDKDRVTFTRHRRLPSTLFRFRRTEGQTEVDQQQILALLSLSQTKGMNLHGTQKGLIRN